MKKEKIYEKEALDEKERQRLLNNFYTKQIKRGKTTRADIFDKISMILVVFLLSIVFLYKIIGNFIISSILGIIIIFYASFVLKKIAIKERNKKIEKIKADYKLKLEEEKVLSPDEDIEDYIIKGYKEKKEDLKESINPYAKGKVIRLYFLTIIFIITSRFTIYRNYYKIMSIITFIVASFIGSYKIIEYMKKKDKESLLDEDNRV